MTETRAIIAALASALALIAFAGAGVAAYPERPIRLVVPYPPGASTNDILGRALAVRLTPRLGQQVVVDNRPGASGTLGSELVAKAQPDGYTLLVAIASPLALGPSVYPKLGYDWCGTSRTSPASPPSPTRWWSTCRSRRPTSGS